MIDLITSKIISEDSNVCLSQHAFHILRKFFQGEYNVERNRIKLESVITEIILEEKDNQIWKRLKENGMFNVLPDLERPHWLIWSILIVSFLIPLIIAIKLHSPFFLFLIPIVSFIFYYISKPLKFKIPKRYKSIKNLVIFLIGNDPGRLGINENSWTRERINAVVKDILYEKAGINNIEYKEDEEFYSYYGLG
jgi:hypothetical protein